jgi:hypothetical protein
MRTFPDHITERLRLRRVDPALLEPGTAVALPIPTDRPDAWWWLGRLRDGTGVVALAVGADPKGTDDDTYAVALPAGAEPTPEGVAAFERLLPGAGKELRDVLAQITSSGPAPDPGPGPVVKAPVRAGGKSLASKVTGEPVAVPGLGRLAGDLRVLIPDGGQEVVVALYAKDPRTSAETQLVAVPLGRLVEDGAALEQFYPKWREELPDLRTLELKRPEEVDAPFTYRLNVAADPEVIRRMREGRGRDAYRIAENAVFRHFKRASASRRGATTAGSTWTAPTGTTSWTPSACGSCRCARGCSCSSSGSRDPGSQP